MELLHYIYKTVTIMLSNNWQKCTNSEIN